MWQYLLYLIIFLITLCMALCHIMYIGLTRRRLADRMTEHISSILNNFHGFSLAQHFNPPSHYSLNDTFCD